jgi:diacylglycerol O-acyltransferase / wax synthase
MSAQRMSNADAAWLHMDRPTNLMVVNALLWFEPRRQR